MQCSANCAVQLALDNVLPPYYSNVFGYSITRAGNIAAIFGCLNFVSRPLGGVMSDVAGKLFGMRGRLWSLFFTLTVGGMAVAVLGTQKSSDKVTIAMMVIAGWFLEVSTHLCWRLAASRQPLGCCAPVAVHPNFVGLPCSCTAAGLGLCWRTSSTSHTCAWCR